MAESSVGSFVKWGLVAGVAWWAYETFIASPALPSTAVAAIAPADKAAPPVTPAPSAAMAAGLSLDRIYQAVVSEMKANPATNVDNGVVSANQWEFNWYLQNRAIPSLPSAAFPAASGDYDISADLQGDPAQKITSAVWWSFVGPKVGEKLGLSGYGLAGLGALFMRRKSR